MLCTLWAFSQSASWHSQPGWFWQQFWTEPRTKPFFECGLGHVTTEAGSSAAALSRCWSVCCCPLVVINAHYNQTETNPKQFWSAAVIIYGNTFPFRQSNQSQIAPFQISAILKDFFFFKNWTSYHSKMVLIYIMEEAVMVKIPTSQGQCWKEGAFCRLPFYLLVLGEEGRNGKVPCSAVSLQT